MLRYVRYQCDFFQAVFRETHKFIAARMFWFVLIAVASAVVAWLLDPESVAAPQAIAAAILGVCAFSYLFVWCVNFFRVPYRRYIEAEDLRSLLTPQIRIDGFHIHQGIGKDTSTLENKEWPIKYLQTQVVNLGVKSIICRPHVVRCEKLAEDATWRRAESDHNVELLWSATGKHELELDQNIPRSVNIVACAKPENRLRFEPKVPIPFYRFFNETGTYRLTVRVAARDQPTQEIVLEVENPEDWNAFAVRQAG